MSENAAIVMLVPVLDLIDALDGSVDMPYGNFVGLFSRKVADCGERFIQSITQEGVEAPICVQVVNGQFIQGNGHHRLAVMFQFDPFGEIPVVFSESIDYMMSNISEGTKDECWY